MKTLIQIVKSFLVSVIIVAGLSYVYAWTSNTQAPTGGNTNPPIDVGNLSQTKLGSLNMLQGFTVVGNTTIDLTSGGNLQIQDGSEGEGKVLTSDSEGNVSWR
ncbi:hypothetical protein IT397_01430 [Candidatus Nomurabacteria bacterium]|nr:hypothetical protein [Candidatus Nomurabacteria bacterium]